MRQEWHGRIALRIEGLCVATENDPDLTPEAARAPTIDRVNGGVLRISFHGDGACADPE